MAKIYTYRYDFFIFLILLLIYVIIKSIIFNKFNYLNLLILITIIYLTRPTSLPFIFAILSFIGLTKIKYNYSQKFILFSTFLIILIIPFIYSIIFEFMNIYLVEKP